MNEKVSIIVPVFNERENLETFVRALFRTLESTKEDFEVLFVDDGSTDGSDLYLETLPEKDPRIKLITFRAKSGPREFYTSSRSSRLIIQTASPQTGEAGHVTVHPRLLPSVYNSALMIWQSRSKVKIRRTEITSSPCRNRTLCYPVGHS